MKSENYSEPEVQEKTPKASINTSVEKSIQIPESGMDEKVGERDLENPASEPESQELWNRPRINFFRYLAAIYAFIIMGMNDAAYGVSFLLLSHQIG